MSAQRPGSCLPSTRRIPWQIVPVTLSLLSLLLIAGGTTVALTTDPRAAAPPAIPLPARFVPPDTVTVDEVEALTKDLEIVSLGCGAGTFDGKFSSAWWNGYSNVRLPWLPEPVEVDVGFVGGVLTSFNHGDVYYRRQPGTNTLVRVRE